MSASKRRYNSNSRLLSRKSRPDVASSLVNRTALLKRVREGISGTEQLTAEEIVAKSRAAKEKSSKQATDRTLGHISSYMKHVEPLNDVMVPRNKVGKFVTEGVVVGHRFDWLDCMYNPKMKKFASAKGYIPYSGKHCMDRYINQNVVLRNIHSLYAEFLSTTLFTPINLQFFCNTLKDKASGELAWLGEKSGIETVPATEHTMQQTLKSIVFWVRNLKCYKLYLVVGLHEESYKLLDYFYCDVSEDRTTLKKMIYSYQPASKAQKVEPESESEKKRKKIEGKKEEKVIGSKRNRIETESEDKKKNKSEESVPMEIEPMEHTSSNKTYYEVI